MFYLSRRTLCDRSTHQCTGHAGDLSRQLKAYFSNLFLDSSSCNNIPPQQCSNTIQVCCSLLSQGLFSIAVHKWNKNNLQFEMVKRIWIYPSNSCVEIKRFPAITGERLCLFFILSWKTSHDEHLNGEEGSPQRYPLYPPS